MPLNLCLARLCKPSDLTFMQKSPFLFRLVSISLAIQLLVTSMVYISMVLPASSTFSSVSTERGSLCGLGRLLLRPHHASILHHFTGFQSPIASPRRRCLSENACMLKLHGSRYNRTVQARDLHTGATVHLWRATVHPRAAVHPWGHGTSKSPVPRYT